MMENDSALRALDGNCEVIGLGLGVVMAFFCLCHVEDLFVRDFDFGVSYWELEEGEERWAHRECHG